VVLTTCDACLLFYCLYRLISVHFNQKFCYSDVPCRWLCWFLIRYIIASYMWWSVIMCILSVIFLICRWSHIKILRSQRIHELTIILIVIVCSWDDLNDLKLFSGKIIWLLYTKRPISIYLVYPMGAIQLPHECNRTPSEGAWCKW